MKALTKRCAEGVGGKLKDEGWSDEQARNALVAVKESLNLVDEKREHIELLLDRTSCVLEYLKMQGVNIGPLEVQMKNALGSWSDTLKEVPTVQVKIAPLIKQQGAKTKGDVSSYEKGVAAYLEEVNAQIGRASCRERV